MARATPTARDGWPDGLDARFATLVVEEEDDELLRFGMFLTHLICRQTCETTNTSIMIVCLEKDILFGVLVTDVIFV